MAIDMFEARSLTNAVNKIKAVDPFVINLLFKGKDKYHAADKIDLEISSSSDKLAQFVAKGGDPLSVKKGIKNIKTISLPMTWEKKTFTADELAAYKALGGIYISAQDLESRANQFVLRELEDLKVRILRRREQMACSAISTGTITVTQDNVSFTVDFDFAENTHLITNASGAKWDAATPSPTIEAQIRTHKSNIMKRTGFAATICILGSDAASAFLNSTAIKTLLDTNNYRIGSIDLNSPSQIYGNYLGRVFGIDFYEYNQTYTNQSGVSTNMIAADRAIFMTQNVAAELNHGPLFRIEGQNLRVHQVDMLIEPRTNDDKTYLEWKINQKSLPTINDPDGIISVDVL